MNYIDLIIILIFVFYVLVDYNQGFLRLCADLLGLAIAIFAALIWYLPLANFLMSHTRVPVAYTQPLSFIAIWVVVQAVFNWLAKIAFFHLPASINFSAINRYLGILPAAIKSAIFIGVAMTLVIMLPLDIKIKNPITHSLVGSQILSATISIQNKLNGNVGQGSTPRPTVLDGRESESVSLGFKTTAMTIDEAAENLILEKINTERTKINIAPLKSDILIRNVARIHSRDMLLSGYFSHNSQDGKTLVDRLTAANANFRQVAENIALAPSVDLVHTGLMNSPRHKANILDPNFTRVGIGVMNAGQYGLMVTQDFAN